LDIILYRLIVALRYFISFWVIENQVTDDGRRAIQLSIQKKGYDLSIDEYVVLQVSHPHLLRLWTDFEFASKPTRIILSLVPIAIEIILVILGYTMTAISLFICMVYYSYHEKKFMPQMTAFIESLN